MKKLFTITLMLFLTLPFQNLRAQVYTFEDFIGTWHGYISSESFGGYNDPITMTIEADGFYTETSGHLMPTIYPNTQQCEYETETNRMHWWYLKTVYAGQYFYQHFFYDVVYFNNDTLEMHYNFWDDPEPYPQVGTIFLVRENLTPPPVNVTAEIMDEGIMLDWNAPDAPPASELLGYNIYYKYDNNPFEMIGFVEETLYTHVYDFMPGIHTYYLTAVYDEGESDPSGEVEVEVLLTSIEDRLRIHTIVYPNPASEFINIQSDQHINSIRLQNNSGHTISGIEVNAKTYKMETNDLPSGLYFLILHTDEGSISEKVIIQ